MFVLIIKQPENQQKSRSNSQSRERDNGYQGENSEGISVEEELSDERCISRIHTKCYVSFTNQNLLKYLFSLSRKDYESDNNIKIDLEGSDFEPNENQG